MAAEVVFSMEGGRLGGGGGDFSFCMGFQTLFLLKVLESLLKASSELLSEFGPPSHHTSQEHAAQVVQRASISKELGQVASTSIHAAHKAKRLWTVHLELHCGVGECGFAAMAATNRPLFTDSTIDVQWGSTIGARFS
jgi:hypothetical protein